MNVLQWKRGGFKLSFPSIEIVTICGHRRVKFLGTSSSSDNVVRNYIPCRESEKRNKKQKNVFNPPPRFKEKLEQWELSFPRGGMTLCGEKVIIAQESLQRSCERNPLLEVTGSTITHVVAVEKVLFVKGGALEKNQLWMMVWGRICHTFHSLRHNSQCSSSVALLYRPTNK